MSHCDSTGDSTTSYLIDHRSNSDCTCDSATSLSMDSCSACDSVYVNCGHTESNDNVGPSGEDKNCTEGAVDNGDSNQEYSSTRDPAFLTRENVDQLHLTTLNDVKTSAGFGNGLVTDVCSAVCNHEISPGVDDEIQSRADVVVSNSCCGGEGDTCYNSDGWRVGCAEIVCDYNSVRDDESIISEGVTASSRDEDQRKLLRKEVTTFTNSISLIGFNEDRIHSHNHISLDKSDALNDRVGSPMKPSAPLASAGKSLEGSDMSTDGSTLSAVDQIPEVPCCPYPPVAHWLADLPQQSQITCISSPPFSLLPTELPSLQFRPIFYICSDQKPPLEQEESCAIDMNILQKSEISNVAHHFTERCDSQLSTLSEKMDICRICHCEGEASNKLISPCLCSGSLKFIHLSCLQKWIKSSDKKSCELCNFDYIMTMKTRPFKQWERLDMAMAERRKIVCSVTFHVIAITCVIWSLYVLIDRTSEEVNSGALDWPFWTKLIVVAIGFTGGLVFMYVQVKMYLQLCLRWRQFNKLISIENAPEDTQLRAEAAARIKARSGEAGGIVNTVALQEVESF